jgi:hypothetical protein
MNPESLKTPALLEGRHPAPERRTRRRVRLSWPLSIVRGPQPERVLSSLTVDLSSGGFSCLLDESLAAGENAVCILGFPCRNDPRTSQALRCEVEVVWVRRTEDGRFVAGCRIDDYTLVA